MNATDLRRGALGVSVAASLIVAPACTSYPSEPFVPGSVVSGTTPMSPTSELQGGTAAAWAIPTYTLLPGDALDVLYNLEFRLSGEDYVLDILDKIHVTVLNHDEVNGDYQVRPDGKISMPYIGSIAVSTLTVDQLVERLKTSYSDRFRDPEIFINVLQFGARIEELKKMISSDRRGQIFEATIRPDGYITLPIVGDLYASGRTPAELNEVITAAYEPHYRGIDVSTIVRDTASNVVYVLGEVSAPGQLQFSRPLTLSQALARAGAQMDTAGLETVVVVNTSLPKPVGRVFNVLGLFTGAGGEDALLGRDDVVFVPKTKIAEADLWVSQYIEQLLLYKGASFSYSVGKRIGN